MVKQLVCDTDKNVIYHLRSKRNQIKRIVRYDFRIGTFINMWTLLIPFSIAYCFRNKRILTVQLFAVAYIQSDIRVYIHYELPSLFPCRLNWACGSCFATIVFLLGPPY